MDETPAARKRPRPVVSCLRCREKKLRCDRVSPCVNCTKAACPADCTYSEGSAFSDRPTKARRATGAVDRHPDQRGNDSGKTGGTGIIEDLQRRVAKLEELLSVRSSSTNCDQVPEISIPDASNEAEHSGDPDTFQGTLLVKGNRSRYHGQNNRFSLLKQFPDAKQYIDRFTEDLVMVGLAKEVQFLKSKSQASSNSPGSVSDSEWSPELMELRASLPPKAVCDQLLEIYTQNFEGVWRILHVPSFVRQYTQFWADLDNDTYRSAFFLPLLTAVLTVSITLADPNIKLSNPSSWEYLNNTAISLIRTWQRKLGRKQQTELATLQVRVLVALSRRLRQVPAEEIWRETGTLVRSAMVMGLHVNPSGYSKLSAFQAEERRRLWITIAELDLQASIESGMPVMTPDLDYRSLSPANLDDADFDELYDTTELPEPRPLHESTDSLLQVTLTTSLSQRVKTMIFINNAGQGRNLKTILEHGLALEEYLRQIPDSLRLDQSHEADTPASLLNRVLLEIQIRRPLLCLNRLLAMPDSEKGADCNAMQQSCLESSLAILSYQDYFDPSVADLDIFNSSVYWDLFQTLCKNDILWAALSVCVYMKESGQNASSTYGVGHLARHTPTYSKVRLIRTVETTLDALIRRVADAGSNVKDIIILSIVLQSVRSRGSTQMKDPWMQEGAKKAFSACRQHLLASVTEESAASSIPGLSQTLQPSQQLGPSNAITGFMPDLLGKSSDLFDEFNSFQGDIFAFDDESFSWNQ